MPTMISRNNAESLIPEAVTREIIQEVPTQSAVMRVARRLPNMTRAQQRMPVLSGLVSADWVDGDTGQKSTSRAEWENVYLNAEELAVIVPIPEAVLDDADYDIWSEIRPRIVEAFGQKFDEAVLWNLNKPTSFPDGITVQAAAASHTVDLSTVVGAGDDIYDAILSENGLFSKVEEDGYSVNGVIAHLSMRAKLRGLRDSQGNPIFKTDVQGPTQYALDGAPMYFTENTDAGTSLLIAGDWRRLVWSVRQDITYKVLSEAVIQDSMGNIVYNLAQQDMVALRAVMRLGWALPNPPNRVNPNEATRFPFAALVA